MDKKLEGILLIDKPSGMTSHDVVDVVRRKLRMKRVGHGGTLDPMATGLLIILVGKATKLFEKLGGLDKGYEFAVKLGEKTDTGDADGKVIETCGVIPQESALIKAAENLCGNMDQIPPMYSAVKINGKKLYEYARSGIKVDVPSRKIEIKENRFISFDGRTAEFFAHVSKGTYIRKLAEDIAEAAGSPGHVTKLRRTFIGDYKIEDSIGLDEITEDKIISAQSADNNAKI